MANNRIYIGNKDTLDYFFIGKAYTSASPCCIEDEEKDIFIDKLNLLFRWSAINDVGDKSPIVIFTDYDDIYDEFFEKGKCIENNLEIKEY